MPDSSHSSLPTEPSLEVVSTDTSETLLERPGSTQGRWSSTHLKPTPPVSRKSSIQPSFKLLIGLTFLTAILLSPFALSPYYLDILREKSVNLHPFIRGELYKQVTGFTSLVFILVEMVLTVRKRGRTWPVRFKVPGTIPFWRTLHIFCGVGLVAMVLIHTVGATGINFNAIFLWVFFGVTLTALMGVVAETGVLESSLSQFGKLPFRNKPLRKGPLIRGLRSIWLLSHIFLVSIFAIMLLIHIFLAYYFQ